MDFETKEEAEKAIDLKDVKVGDDALIVQVQMWLFYFKKVQFPKSGILNIFVIGIRRVKS